MESKAKSMWKGSWKQGTGTISTDSKVLDEQPYTYATRFEDPKGAGPEELLAAAHAGCINQALSNIFGQKGYLTESIDTTVSIKLGRDDREKLQIKASHITSKIKVDGVSDAEFAELAEIAKAGCTISRALNIEIILNAIKI
ncbi:osmotically inducible protein OsmC [Pedobacter westerhofensis]|uniref:Osmotically inducible protein OsmC n=1 Tax=Pedobacter westerhofensis TaxID=425512 RepID=A0A521BQB3_9SPHI|nr:OsmC family peroxiredoxin [Pedobacter westerhofensis]SMO49352.1 osmotically inducible protein OsmC [Pedobacter westerhofensis]